MSADLYKGIVEDLFDGVYFLDRERRITYWNRGAERITGYAADDVIGRHCSDNILVHTDCEGSPMCRSDLCPAASVMRDGRQRDVRAYLHHRDGHRLQVRIRTTPIYDDSGEIVGAVEIFAEDSVEQQLSERVRELEHMALLDPLTTIGNRRFVELRINQRLDELRRYGWPFGVLFIDVDHFKEFNDRHGHALGDRVLQMVARTLQNSVRSFDIVGRWGGEEFLAIISNCRSAYFAAAADRLRALVGRSALSNNGEAVSITVSIGATLARPDDDIESLVERADELMYKSKAKGRNQSSHDLSSEVDLSELPDETDARDSADRP